MNTVQLIPAQTNQALHTLAALACEIWHEYWPCVLSDEQIDYMVTTMQSFDAIRKEVDEGGYWYYLLVDNTQQAIGYLSIRIEDTELFVSKVYLKKEARGKHYASYMLDFCEEVCRHNGLSSMYLHVNKYNEMGIRAYKGRGWHTAKESVTDIGKGFIMDDYIMEKKIATD